MGEKKIIHDLNVRKFLETIESGETIVGRATMCVLPDFSTFIHNPSLSAKKAPSVFLLVEF